MRKPTSVATVRLSSTLSLYVARIYALWFLVFFAGLAGVILVADTLELLRRTAARPEASLALVLTMALMKMPRLLQDLMPFAVLFAGIMAFWRLTRSSELVVARAVGVSVWQFLTPAIVVAVAAGAVKIAMLSPLSAVLTQRFEVLEARVVRGQAPQTAIAGSGLWLRQARDDGGEVMIHAERGAPLLDRFERVTVLLLDAAGRFEVRVDAPSAQLRDGSWILSDARLARSGQPAQPVGEWRIASDFTAERIQDSFAPPETMSFWALPGFIQLLEQAGFAATRHKLHYQALLASPLLLAAMVLIAATFSLRISRRGGVGMRIAAGVLVGFLLYFLSDLVFALGLSRRIPVELAAWAPAVVSTLLGVATLLHQEDG
ncbi:MAG: LPS export ABC transporter permease LptG [Alphaproteobacteria bacterium]|nr:LPS export ABC transporter permease LptG [Alphaproteobacteria bacterium]